MKKILLIFTLSLSIFLSGCIPVNDDDINNYTEDELTALIEELIPSVDTTYDLKSFQTQVKDMLKVARNGVIGVISASVTGGGTGSGVIYKREGTT